MWPFDYFKKKDDVKVKNNWDSGRPNRAFGKTVGNPGPNQANRPYLYTLRSRVRDEVRNFSLAERSVDVPTTEMIGTGITPLPIATGNTKAILKELWENWEDEADFDENTDIYGLQALATRAWKESGECFIRMIVEEYDGGNVVPLKLQVLESDMVPLGNGKAPGSGNEILSGIEFKNGKKLAYWVHKKHPGDYPFGYGFISDVSGSYNDEKMIRVPVDEMVHIYKPTRPGQLRGFPSISGILQNMTELGDFDEATLERQKAAAALTTFIRRPVPIDPGIDPVTGEEIDPEVVQESTIKPGSAYTLLPGEEIDTPNMPDMGDGYKDFVTNIKQQIAVGPGIPYELLTGDYSGTNDRTVRVALSVFRRKLQQELWGVIVFQMCRKIWKKLIEVAVLNGMVSVKMLKIKVRWNPQAWEYINPLQDVQTKSEKVKNGFISRTSIIMEQGDDPEQIDKERAEDKIRENELQISTQAKE